MVAIQPTIYVHTRCICTAFDCCMGLSVDTAAFSLLFILKYAHMTTHVLESFGVLLFVSHSVRFKAHLKFQCSATRLDYDLKCELRQSNTFISFDMTRLLCGTNKSRFQSNRKRMQNSKIKTRKPTILTAQLTNSSKCMNPCRRSACSYMIAVFRRRLPLSLNKQPNNFIIVVTFFCTLNQISNRLSTQQTAYQRFMSHLFGLLFVPQETHH